MSKKLSASKQAKALAVIAEWMGRIGYGTEPGKPAPTGKDAAWRGLGPMLVPDWDWPTNGPTPTILLEGGPESWAYRATGDSAVHAAFTKLGIFAEPYAGYALCLYPADY